MPRGLAFAFALASIPTALLAQHTGTPLTPSALVKTYCVSCHSDRARHRGVALDRIHANKPAEQVETWERVLRQLRARTMPPMGAPRPDSKSYEATIAALTNTIDVAAMGTASRLSARGIALRLARLIWNAEPDQPLIE